MHMAAAFNPQHQGTPQSESA
jgi:hypothetical protein